MYTQKMHEVQSDATLTNHGYLGYAVIVNKAFWDGLPAPVRAGLERAMTEATAYANDIAQSENDGAMEAMVKSARRNSTSSHRRRAQSLDRTRPAPSTRRSPAALAKICCPPSYAATGSISASDADYPGVEGAGFLACVLIRSIGPARRYSGRRRVRPIEEIGGLQ